MRIPYFVHLLASIILCTGLILLMMLISTMPHVQAKAARQQQGRANNQTGAVTILVLDMSGSMSSNDPDGLRCSAANAFIDLSGPGNYIGAVDLNGTGASGGPHHFQQAQTWANPAEMATPEQRQALQNTIKTQSHNCQPGNATPTYDALNRAAQMLQQTTQSQNLPGSVVLLTDGAPDPDTTAQVNAIQSDLLPRFKQHSWAIDTIALGTDGPMPAGTPYHTLHDFLNGLSNATSGKFYDDANGVIQGQPSPLNIAPFFVDIFARHNHRTVGDDIGLTQLQGSKSRAFNVTGYTDALDVIAIKDQPGTSVTLQTPANQRVNAQPGVFVSNSDPHYVVYSIDRPQQGSWTLTATGSGQFLMKSLKTSALSIADLAIAQNDLQITPQSALALGQPLTITTQMSYHGVPVTDNSLTVNGNIAYNGGGGHYSQDFSLSSQKTPGTYTGSVLIPENAPTGAYDLTANAFSVSLANPVSSQVRSIRLEQFPEPVLVSPTTQQPTTTAPDITATQWDPLLQILYSLPVQPVAWLSRWPLQDHTAQPTAIIHGQMELQQQPYRGAQTRVDMRTPGEKTATPTAITNQPDGSFSLPIQGATDGLYTLTFHTSGSFAQSHGDFGSIQRSARLHLVPASWSQELSAWAITALYIVLLAFLVLLARCFVLPHPFGGALLRREDEIIGNVRFNRARRSLWQRLLHPDKLLSSQVGMPGGLRFHFKRAGGIETQPHGSMGRVWQRGDGSPLPHSFQETHELHYQPALQDLEADDDKEEPVIYQINAQRNSTASALSADEYGEEQAPPYTEAYSSAADPLAMLGEQDFLTAPTKKARRGQRKQPRKQQAVEDEFDW